MRNNLYILSTLLALLMFAGCGLSKGATNTDTKTLVNTGETVTVLAGDVLTPAEAGTQVEVNDTSGDGNSTVTVVSGSAWLVPKH